MNSSPKLWEVGLQVIGVETQGEVLPVSTSLVVNAPTQSRAKAIAMQEAKRLGYDLIPSSYIQITARRC